MYRPNNNSVYFVNGLALYDAFFTTKSYGVSELLSMGCPRVFFVDNAFDPALHHPVAISEEERKLLGGPVGFLGFYEEQRGASIQALLDAGIAVRVHGWEWEKNMPPHPLLRMSGPIIGQGYAKAICAIDINLGFLRKKNRDLSTTRSIEIPACGAFMLAERTEEHCRLFKEGEEAEFFGDDRELVDKAKRYLADPFKRSEIARRGRERCLTGGYSNKDRIAWMLEKVLHLRDSLKPPS